MIAVITFNFMKVVTLLSIQGFISEVQKNFL